MSFERSRPSLTRLSPLQAWVLVGVATLTMSVSYLDRQTLAAISTRMRDVLHMNETEYGWVQSAFSIAYLVGAPLAGRWIDRIGARRGLIASMLLWSMVAASHALVPTIGVLFALRVGLGFAESPSFPGAAQTVQRALPPEQRSAGFGVVFTGSSIGAAVAAPLAIALEKHWGWQRAFVGTAVVGLAWLPLWILATRSASARGVLDVPADGEPAHEAMSFRDIVTLLRDRAVIRAVIAVIGTAPVIAFALLWFSLFLKDVHHVPQDDQGRYLWIPPVLFDLGSVGFGLFASRLERSMRDSNAPHRVLFAFAAILTSAMFLVPAAPGPLGSVLVGGIAAMGGGGVFALLTSDMLARVPSSRVSAAGGLTAAAQSLAYIVANPLIGASVRHTHHYVVACATLGAWAIVPCVVWLVWTPPPRRAIAE